MNDGETSTLSLDRVFLFRRIFVRRDFRRTATGRHFGHRRHYFRLLPLRFAVPSSPSHSLTEDNSLTLQTFRAVNFRPRGRVGVK
jgi:hypothetical protein